MSDNCDVCGSNDIKYKSYNFHVYNFFQITYMKLVLKSRFLSKHFKKFLPTEVKKIRDNQFKGKVILCNNCGYGSMEKAPTPKELEEYYDSQYWGQREVENNKIVKDYHKDYRAIYQVNFVVEHIKQHEQLNVLEIGGGPCLFSLLLRDKYPNALLNVCEPSSQWKSHYTYHKINKVANFYPFEVKQKYNYIHTSHWLEHVHDLHETIEYLKGHLEKGGFLFIEVPNCDADYWDLPILDTPHIQFFTPSSLNKCMTDNGFKLIKSETAGITTKEWWIDKKEIKKEDYGTNERGNWIRSVFQLT